MKKRVKKTESNFNNLLILLVVIIIASLVVDLLSLNVLYSISNEGGLKGELAESSAQFTCEYRCYYDMWLSDDENQDEIKKVFDSCMQHCYVLYNDFYIPIPTYLKEGYGDPPRKPVKDLY